MTKDKKKKTLEEISNEDYPPLTSEWIKEYLDSMDIHHLIKILEKLETDTFENLEGALQDAIKLDAEARRLKIKEELKEIDNKLEKLK